MGLSKFLAGVCLLAILFRPGWGQESRASKEGASPDMNKVLVSALLESSKDRDEKVRIHAASALCSLDYHAVPALVVALDSKDRGLRAEAAKILGNMGTHGRRHAEALSALAKALKDEDTEVRRWASYAISQIVVPSRP